MPQTELKLDKKPVAMPHHLRTTLLICASAIGVVVAGFLLWWRYAEPSTARYQPLIAMLEHGDVRTDRPGHVDLSRLFPGLTPHDEMMITRRNDGSFLMLFPTQYGEGSQIVGLLYTSRALLPQDTRLRESAIRFSERLIDVGTYAGLLIDDRINEHWYHVSYRMR